MFTAKVAIVTGGASGIGLATAMRLGRLGATVVIADVSAAAAEAAAAQVAAGGATTWASACDVSLSKRRSSPRFRAPSIGTGGGTSWSTTRA